MLEAGKDTKLPGKLSFLISEERREKRSSRAARHENPYLEAFHRFLSALAIIELYFPTGETTRRSWKKGIQSSGCTKKSPESKPESWRFYREIKALKTIKSV